MSAGFLILTALVWHFGLRDPDASRPKATEPTSPGAGGDESALIARFVGDQACARCHPGEFAAHRGSGHPHTLKPPTRGKLIDRIVTAPFADPEYPGVSWRFDRTPTGLALTRTEAGDQARMTIDHVFGSGHHGASFVSLAMRTNRPGERIDIEHRVSYFAAEDRLFVTPGQGQPHPVAGTLPFGRLIGAAELRACFSCHTTLLSNRSLVELDPQTMVRGVNCERCHGPGKEHIANAEKGDADLAMPHGPDTPAAEQIELCGQCHRHPDQFDFQKIRPDNPEIVRFQPIGLLQSKCYRASRGALACSTCHDPHARTSKDQEMYNMACIKCHDSGDASRPACSAPGRPTSDCVSCHMPRRDAIGGLTFADHWIRKPESAKEKPR